MSIPGTAPFAISGSNSPATHYAHIGKGSDQYLPEFLMPQEIERYWKENASSSAGERLEFWKRSASFIADAPVLGHGTGAIRELFRQSAVGDNGPSALISPNPHNQTLAVAIQLGLVGAAVLYAMWIGHLYLFRAGGLAAWVGLVIAAQNIVSSLFNSHLFDFTQGWIYVLGVGVAGGTVLRDDVKARAAQRRLSERKLDL